jgi:hypothetical protein
MTPTYRNDGTKTLRMTNFSGEAVNVPPGHTVSTRDILTESFMTKTSDIPFSSPTLGWNTVSLGVGCSGEVNYDSTILKGLDIFNTIESSGEALVYFNNTSGARAPVTARLGVGRSIEFGEMDVRYKVSKLVIESALGSVVEVRSLKV